MVEKGTEITPTSPHELEETQTRLTPAAIANIAEQMALAEQLVSTLLRYGIDYGITPGTQGPGLWDPGAAKIIRAFRCYAQHKVLFHEESDDLISWTIEAQLVNEAGQIVGSGLGGASTREPKYKYRWEPKAEVLRVGYTEEDIKELKVREDDRGVRYRIENPEYGELVHTLLSMASKRAEVDAAKSLPGVGSALRAKFDPKAQKQATAPAATTDDIPLPTFWAIIKGAGLTEENVHKALQVESVKHWVQSGKTLREAVTRIMGVAVTAIRSAKAQPATPGPAARPPERIINPSQITRQHVPNVGTLLELATTYWNSSEEEVWRALGYADRQNFLDADVQTPFEAFQALLELHSS